MNPTPLTEEEKLQQEFEDIVKDIDNNDVETEDESEEDVEVNEENEEDKK